ncbi:MAG: hypothetical protein RLZZ387_4187 [Chloroflexota bacterium]|jgi:4-hydroxyphenylpyruvate dioxygenase
MKLSQLAINSVSTRQETLEEALVAYAGAGFQSVEFVLPLVKGWIAQGRTPADARRLSEAHGLRSIGGFQAALVCFGTEEEQQANRALQLENARLIHDLGGGTLVVGTDGPAQPGIDALETVADALRSLATATEGLDVTIALEFNWGPLVKSLQSAVHVARLADHPRVGVLFDPAHYHTTVTKFEHLTAETVPWIRHVHLNDMRDKPGELSNCNSDRVLPGEGILDLPALIGALERHGYRGFFSIELFNADLWALPAAETARRCYASLAPLCEPERTPA